jgi:hypothetical protein
MSIIKVKDKLYQITDQTMLKSSPEKLPVFSTRGTGIFVNNVLSITYQSRRSPLEQGVEQLIFSQDAQSSYGTWAQLGGDIMGTESCKRNQGPVSTGS